MTMSVQRLAVKNLRSLRRHLAVILAQKQRASERRRRVCSVLDLMLGRTQIHLRQLLPVLMACQIHRQLQETTALQRQMSDRVLKVWRKLVLVLPVPMAGRNLRHPSMQLEQRSLKVVQRHY